MKLLLTMNIYIRSLTAVTKNFLAVKSYDYTVTICLLCTNNMTYPNKSTMANMYPEKKEQTPTKKLISL